MLENETFLNQIHGRHAEFPDLILPCQSGNICSLCIEKILLSSNDMIIYKRKALQLLQMVSNEDLLNLGPDSEALGLILETLLSALTKETHSNDLCESLQETLLKFSVNERIACFCSELILSKLKKLSTSPSKGLLNIWGVMLHQAAVRKETMARMNAPNFDFLFSLFHFPSQGIQAEIAFILSLLLSSCQQNCLQLLPDGVDALLARFLVRAEKSELKRNLLGLTLIMTQIRPVETFNYEPYLDALKPSLMAIELDVRMAALAVSQRISKISLEAIEKMIGTDYCEFLVEAQPNCDPHPSLDVSLSFCLLDGIWKTLLHFSKSQSFIAGFRNGYIFVLGKIIKYFKHLPSETKIQGALLLQRMITIFPQLSCQMLEQLCSFFMWSLKIEFVELHTILLRGFGRLVSAASLNESLGENQLKFIKATMDVIISFLNSKKPVTTKWLEGLLGIFSPLKEKQNFNAVHNLTMEYAVNVIPFVEAIMTTNSESCALVFQFLTSLVLSIKAPNFGITPLLVQKGFLHTSLDQLPTTQGIHLFLLGLVVSAEIIPRDYLYPVKESLSELPSEPSEILSLLTIPGSRCHLGISNSSLYYLQVFSIGLIALGCQFDVWAFPPTNVEGALYQFVSQNEGASSLPIQLHLHLASIFARLDSAIQPSAHQRVKRDKWLTSSILQTTPSVAPPSHVVNWLWNQQPLREWNQRCLVFWLFESSSPLDDSFWVELLAGNQLVSSQTFLGVLKTLPRSSREAKTLSVLEILSLGLKKEPSLSTVLSFVGLFEVLGDLMVGGLSEEAILSSICNLVHSVLESMASVEQQIKSEVIVKSWGILQKLIRFYFQEKDSVKLCRKGPRQVLNLCNFCLHQLKGNPFTESALNSSKIFDLFHPLVTIALPSLLQIADSLVQPSIECQISPNRTDENGICEAQAEVSLLLASVFIAYSQLFFFSKEVPSPLSPLSSWVPPENWGRVLPLLLHLGYQNDYTPLMIAGVSQALSQWVLSSPKNSQKEIVVSSALYCFTTLWGLNSGEGTQGDNLFHCLAELALSENFSLSTVWFWRQVEKVTFCSSNKLTTSPFEVDILIWALKSNPSLASRMTWHLIRKLIGYAADATSLEDIKRSIVVFSQLHEQGKLPPKKTSVEIIAQLISSLENTPLPSPPHNNNNLPEVYLPPPPHRNKNFCHLDLSREDCLLLARKIQEKMEGERRGEEGK